MDLLSKLGVDWRLLIGQIINFLIVLAILYKFAYRPILGFLRKREEKIAKSLLDAQKIEENLKSSEKQKKEIIVLARQEAEGILRQAETAAEKFTTEAAQKARLEMEKIKQEAKSQIEQEKQKAFEELKNQTADLVISLTEKILTEKITDKKDKEMIEETIKSVL